MKTKQMEQSKEAVRHSGSKTVEAVRHPGSMTVEASLLMGVILMVIVLILQMTLFLTDTVRMDSLITEDSTYTVKEETERSAWFRSVGGFFFLKTDGVHRNAGKKKVKESYSQTGISLGFRRTEKVDKAITRSVRDPVGFLHLVQAALNKEE